MQHTQLFFNLKNQTKDFSYTIYPVKKINGGKILKLLENNYLVVLYIHILKLEISGCDSIAGAGCGLICVGAGEKGVRKVYALRGLRGVERQVGSARGTQWPAGSSAGRMVVRKAKRSR
jgi:hypothetical protein